MEGEIVYLFVYDAGAKFTEEQLKGLLSKPEDFSKYEYTQPTPEEIVSISVPFVFNLKDETFTNSKKENLKFKVQCSIFTTGSFSIRVRHHFESADADFIKFMAFDNAVYEFAEKTSAKARLKVEGSLSKLAAIRPSDQKERYNFYYIKGDQAEFVRKYQSLITGLMIDEQDPASLEANYSTDVLKRKISYNANDVMYVGWEGAVMISPEKSYEYELLLAEIANMQLLELRIHHNAISKKIADTDLLMAQAFTPNRFSKGVDFGKLNISLGELYGNTKDIITAVNDTIYGFGEWYLVKLYGLFNDAFQIDEWRAYLDSDLETVEKRRAFVSELISVSRARFLEIIVIVLILIEILLSLVSFFRI
ncbi:Uncharacterised protein [uncultured archaeon]|nr:Uncharacterised protein [uncultured archaeon]